MKENVMLVFEPGEYMTCIFSVSDTGILEPMTFRLLVRMLQETRDNTAWELGL